VIERAAILGDGRRLEVARALGVSPPLAALATSPVANQTLTRLEDVIRQHIEAALNQCHGRVEGPFGAARLLDLNPHTLRSKMRKLGVAGQRFRSES
jgi:DNA-binding NtrC family response regulator